MSRRALLIHTAALLSLMLSGCLSADDDRVGTTCGNGIVEGYEECDGDDFYHNNCYHFMPEGARSTWDTQTQRLKCNPDCTIDASECLYCGDGRLDTAFEECDNETLGGASCDLVWSGGGALTCSLSCTLQWESCVERASPPHQGAASKYVALTPLPGGGWATLRNDTDAAGGRTVTIDAFDASLTPLPGTFTLPDRDDMVGAALTSDASGALYLAAHHTASPDGDRAILVARIPGESNAPPFQTSLGSAGDDVVSDLVVDATGALTLAGYTNGTVVTDNLGGDDFYVARLSGDGSLLWELQWGTASHDRLKAITCDASGTIYVAGVSAGYTMEGLGGRSGYIAAIDREGALLWEALWGTGSEEWAWDITTDASGLVYVAGTTMGDLYGNSNAGGFGDLALLVYTADGRRTLVHQFGTTADDEATALCVNDASGEIHLTGYYGESGAYGQGGGNIMLHTVSSEGTTIKTTSWATDNYETGSAIACLPQSVLIAGWGFDAPSEDATPLAHPFIMHAPIFAEAPDPQ